MNALVRALLHELVLVACCAVVGGLLGAAYALGWFG